MTRNRHGKMETMLTSNPFAPVRQIFKAVASIANNYLISSRQALDCRKMLAFISNKRLQFKVKPAVVNCCSLHVPHLFISLKSEVLFSNEVFYLQCDLQKCSCILSMKISFIDGDARCISNYE
ncbi:hypothetical protein TNIN_202491 [Trichonephila inaurata madagascariensis]|uniref:Uncharacterized protein n=1 Tax=Trichonephila inaurata madagascariensis TaxID=2747483 RepID=A0A8X6YH17_9ARAC|nr:hypothetical protein TNIN_202491 [Trichonephila inaurata madagascariensis]